MMQKICPIFPSSNLKVTEAFYVRLGFHRVYADDTYLLMQRDKVEVHFVPKRKIDKATNDHGAYLRTDDAKGLSEEWARLGLPASGAPRFHQAQDTAWGMREMVMIDPDGNLIRAGQDLSNG
jgi:catechol 2,3-dioxygenase-like lactoylglutathione lyase family enzyme